MTSSDRIEQFFEELGQRGHEPLLDRMEGTGLFEVSDDGHIERWLVAVRGGYITVSRGEGDADWVMRAERRAFERIIHGDAGAVAALIRGTLNVELINPDLRFGLLTRLFAGPPETRKQWIDDGAVDE